MLTKLAIYEQQSFALFWISNIKFFSLGEKYFLALSLLQT